MYDIALSVGACARSGTRADVAWMIEPRVSDEALAFTPGGGRIGHLASGAFDSLLAEVASRQLSAGRVVRHTVTAVESAICGLPEGSAVTFMVVPAEQFPADTWPTLLTNAAIEISATLRDDVVTDIRVAGSDSGSSQAELSETEVTTVLVPLTRLVIAGRGPIAEALGAQGQLLGWKIAQDARPEAVAGLTASLGPGDAVVVMGHDVESSSRCLMSALESDAGYIGALGSQAMQRSRADWLAYRDVTDVTRVHGPAGLDIGAGTPEAIAVSIVAEIISVLR